MLVNRKRPCRCDARNGGVVTSPVARALADEPPAADAGAALADIAAMSVAPSERVAAVAADNGGPADSRAGRAVRTAGALSAGGASAFRARPSPRPSGPSPPTARWHRHRRTG